MKKEILKIVVDGDHNNHRIDKFLQKKLIEFSRTKLQNLIKDGNIKLNNLTTLEVSKKIKTKDEIEINFPPPKNISIKPNKMDLKILYEDDDIIVINKDPGVVVHPGAGNYENTIVNGLLYFYKNKLSKIGGVLRPGIVHRIDKDTSGVIVVAKNDQSHMNLSKQFSEHTIQRVYEALIWGSLMPKKGNVNEKITRSSKNRQLMTVSKSKGKKAITNYKTLKVFQNSNLPKISLIECKLETGRTHQIRVHMNFKGNPILGDPSYGKSKKKFKEIDKNFKKQLDSFNRQALHAKILAFKHPRTGEEISFNSKRPNDFQNLIKTLQKCSI